MIRSALCAALAVFAACAGEARAQTADLEAAIATLRQAADAPGFSGAIVVMRGDDVLFAEARGYADQASRRANTLDTRFNIASVGKFLTALGYVRAAQDADVTDFAQLLPATVLDGVVSADLTMADLMAHRTTAISFGEAPNAESRLAAARSNADFFQLVRDANAQPIGRRNDGLAYNNSNAIVTGEVIAALTRQSYEDALRRLVLEPAGATGAMFARAEQAAALNLARPYVPEGFDPESMRPGPAPSGPPPSAYPELVSSPLGDAMSSAAGGLYMSASDLARVGAAALNGSIVSREQLAALCTSQAPVPRLVLGLGCGGSNFGPGQRRWGHNGGAPGVNAELALFPDQGVVLAVVANHHMRASPVMFQFEAALFEMADGGGGMVIRRQ